MLVPGHCLGVLGGGQLGRMFVSAASAMGYHTIVFDPDEHSPAARIATRHIQKPYDSLAAIEVFTDRCDAVTLEFENVPVRTLQKIAQHCPTYPSVTGLENTQDRCVEKNFLRDNGIDTVEFVEIPQRETLADKSDRLPFPSILKTARFGYDGKGQARVASLEQAQTAFDGLGAVACILEEQVDLATEVSVIVARGVDGYCACYPVSENIHYDGILHASIAPARIDDELRDRATAIARRIAEKLDYRGVLGVEFFITTDGRLLVNEIAPRPHNSGHYTIDACYCSQFEQVARIMSDHSCGATTQFSPVVMINILGDVWDRGAPQWNALLDQPHIKLHLYGKNNLNSRRKMGHFCVLGDDIDKIAAEAEHRWRQLANLNQATP